MRSLFVLASFCAALQAADSGPWTAPLAPREVHPPRPDIHPIDAFLGEPKAVVADALFARRAYLDVWGLLPTPKQVDEFKNDPAKDKRERLIDRLLAHNENYSSHWITFWNDLLRNDEGVIYHGERKSVTPWLKKSLEENLGYDKFVNKLLNPAGPNDPDGFLTGVTWRGVVNASELPPMQAAQNSAQLFLGINLKCNSCHDSFISRWKLADAYGLASFFADGPLELVRCDVKQGRTAETKFLFPELGSVAQGMPLAERRAAAARLFTMPENGRLSRTYVNRIWAQLLGEGLVANVDDMAARPKNPDLLDWLANDFAAHGYDSKYLLRTIMTSHAYQSAGVAPRRLSAEQFLDGISSITGEWRVRENRATKTGEYAREWRFKSSPLSRALGRPVRDQVTTTRLTQPTTLQALELVNGSTLAARLHRGALALEGKLPAAPRSLFDSGVMRGAKAKPEIDIDVTGLSELWVLLEDVDSYDPANVKVSLSNDAQPLPLGGLRKIELKGAKRFQATAVIDPASTTSDVNAAVRIYIFGQKPDLERLLPVAGEPPVPRQQAGDVTQYLFKYAFSREAAPAELALARKAESVEDLLWMIVMSPEFQYIR